MLPEVGLGPQFLALAAAALVCGALALLALLNLYCFLTLGVYRGKEKMQGKTVIVTGANSGTYSPYSRCDLMWSRDARPGGHYRRTWEVT